MNKQHYTPEQQFAILDSFITYNNCKDILLEIIENNMMHKDFACHKLFMNTIANNNGYNVYYSCYQICCYVVYRWNFTVPMQSVINRPTLFDALCATRKFAEYLETIDDTKEQIVSRWECVNDCNQQFQYNYDGLLQKDSKILREFLTETNIKSIVMFWLDNAYTPSDCFLNLMRAFCGNPFADCFAKSFYVSFCNYLRTFVKRRYVHEALCVFPLYREFYKKKLFERICAFLLVCEDYYENYDVNEVVCKVFSNDYVVKQICSFVC